MFSMTGLDMRFAVARGDWIITDWPNKETVGKEKQIKEKISPNIDFCHIWILPILKKRAICKIGETQLEHCDKTV